MSLAPLGFRFNAAAVEPTAPMGAVPAGTYNVQLDEVKLIPVKSDASQSQYELAFVIIDGPYKGRKGWIYLNIHNPDEQKRAMAQADLSAICRAVNVIEIDDMGQLLGRPMTCDFKLVKGTEQYPDDKNKLRNFKPYAGPAASVATPGFASAPQAPMVPQVPGAFASAPAPLAPPPAMPQGFALPGQQTAPGFAPPASVITQPAVLVAPAPQYAPPAPGFAPPAPPPGMPGAPAWGTVPQQ